MKSFDQAAFAALARNLSPDDIRKAAALGITYDRKRGVIVGTPETEKAANEAAWMLCGRSPEYFILDSGYVRTLDNQKKWDCANDACRHILASVVPKPCPKCGWIMTTRDPIQPFPAERDDIRKVLQVYQLQQLIALAKSRRLMATELTCAYALWLMMFRRGVLGVFQSDKEEKANENVMRVHGMWSRLPEWMKSRKPANPTKHGQHMELYFEIPANHSRIKGIPSGPKQIREMGPTFYFCDEAAFHENAMECYSAVQGAIEAGCQAVYVSTAAAGFFAGLCLDALHMVGGK